MKLKKPKRKISHPEDDLQIKVAEYINSQYPDILWCHPPNGGYRNVWEAIRFNKMGVLKGLSDVIIFEEKTRKREEYIDEFGGKELIEETVYNGLAIELKIKPNKPTTEQVDFQQKLSKRGWLCKICYDFESAKQEIDDYLHED